MKKLFQKLWPIIVYGIFGVLTTVVNVAVYHGCYEIINISNLVSTIIAWFVAVAFAFVTNKIFVFESRSWETDVALPELVKFVSCRVGTGVFEVGFMLIFVDILHFDGTISKLITNFVVIVLNFILSKLVIFRKEV